MVLSIDVPYGWLSTSAEGKVLVTRPSGRAAPPQKNHDFIHRSPRSQARGSPPQGKSRQTPASSADPCSGPEGVSATSCNDRHTSQSTEILDAGFRASRRKAKTSGTRYPTGKKAA